MTNKKRLCTVCGTKLIKIRDFIRQSGYSYYLECPKCEKKEKEKLKTLIKETI